MSNSFVEFNKKGFWINDSLLSLVASYIFHFLKENRYEELLSLEMLADIELCARGYNSGFLALNFDEHFKVESNKAEFISMLDDIILEMQQKSTIIDPSELNIIQMDIEYNGIWTEGLERSKILNVCFFLKRLLEGNLDISVGDKVYYDF